MKEKNKSAVDLYKQVVMAIRRLYDDILEAPWSRVFAQKRTGGRCEAARIA